jgi:hypothetical protein
MRILKPPETRLVVLHDQVIEVHARMADTHAIPPEDGQDGDGGDDGNGDEPPPPVQPDSIVDSGLLETLLQIVACLVHEACRGDAELGTFSGGDIRTDTMVVHAATEPSTLAARYVLRRHGNELLVHPRKLVVTVALLANGRRVNARSVAMATATTTTAAAPSGTATPTHSELTRAFKRWLTSTPATSLRGITSEPATPVEYFRPQHYFSPPLDQRQKQHQQLREAQGCVPATVPRVPSFTIGWGEPVEVDESQSQSQSTEHGIKRALEDDDEDDDERESKRRAVPNDDNEEDEVADGVSFVEPVPVALPVAPEAPLMRADDGVSAVQTMIDRAIRAVAGTLDRHVKKFLPNLSHAENEEGAGERRGQGPN